MCHGDVCHGDGGVDTLGCVNASVPVTHLSLIMARGKIATGNKGGAMKRVQYAVAAAALLLAIAGCASPASPASPASEVLESQQAPRQEAASTQEQTKEMAENKGETSAMKMSIGGTDVTVEWENNQAVADLQALVANGPLTVDLSMYGGFEQVGSLGKTLTANDVQTTTTAGDVVLYSGNQIVVFYGSNSWAYTRLGHITSQDAEGMANLLGNGDVSMTIASGSEG